MKYVFRGAREPKKELDSEAILASIREKTFARLKVRAVPRPVKGSGALLEPVLPPDLTVLTDEQLGRLYSEFACMAQYVQLNIAIVAVSHSIAKAEDKLVRARVRLGKVGTNADKEAKTELDPRAKRSGMGLLFGEGVHVMTEAMMAAYIIGRDATSREMTRRGLTSRDPFPNR